MKDKKDNFVEILRNVFKIEEVSKYDENQQIIHQCYAPSDHRDIIVSDTIEYVKR